MLKLDFVTFWTRRPRNICFRGSSLKREGVKKTLPVLKNLPARPWANGREQIKKCVISSLLCTTSFVCGGDIYFSKSSSPAAPLTFTCSDWKGSENGDGSLISWWREDPQGIRPEQHFFQFSNVLASGKTSFQSYVVIDTVSYGKMLYIDGEIQSSEKDEFIYHESLVHPAMTLHPSPQSVLIVGAGEGASTREVLRHPTVKRVVLIDIDDEVIRQTQALLPEWHQGSFSNPKVELLIMDGKEFVQTTQEKFDVIIIDICDRIEGNSAEELYTRAFYSELKKILAPSGIVVIQAMEFDYHGTESHLFIYRNVKPVFKHTASYTTFIPSFWSNWGYIIASDVHRFDVQADTIDAILRERKLSDTLLHYDGLTHLRMFILPKCIRTKVK